MEESIIDNNTPLVSVIVPAYNHERYIDDLLDSLIDQSYPNIELLICDDSSKDDTFNKILNRKQELEKRFKRVCICQNEENLGVVKTLNKLISLTQGKYIKDIASDDIILHDGIEKLVSFYENNQQYDLIFSNCIICDENTHYPINACEYQTGYPSRPDLSGNVYQKMFESNLVLGSTFFVLRKTYEIFGYYDENFGIEDWEYCLRIAQNGKIGFVDEKTVAYRIVKTSQCHYTRDLSGRIRFRRMYNNIIRIHKKYNSSKLDLRKGYSKVYSLLLSLAIDSEDNKAIKHIFRVCKRLQLKLDIEVIMKYVFYRLHILLPIQEIKRKLGMETGGV